MIYSSCGFQLSVNSDEPFRNFISSRFGLLSWCEWFASVYTLIKTPDLSTKIKLIPVITWTFELLKTLIFSYFFHWSQSLKQKKAQVKYCRIVFLNTKWFKRSLLVNYILGKWEIIQAKSWSKTSGETGIINFERLSPNCIADTLNELVSKFSVGLKSLLHHGLSEPVFYGDLVYKFQKIVGRADFSDQFRNIIVRYKRIGYNINIMRQSACLVFNPITVNNFASLFNCTPVGRASDSVMAPT